MIVFEGLLTSPAHVAVDDGGVRIQTKGSGRYVPFASVSDASVAFTVLNVALLRLVMRDGSRTTVRIPKRDALEVQSDILQHLAPAEGDVALGEGAAVAFARNGQTLLDWLGSVARWAQSSGGYRSAALDHVTASATLADARVAAELRAACAHAMLSTGDEEELAAVARIVIDRALPPLVVVAVRLGRGGAALVPDRMCDEALPFLPRDDQDAAAKAMAAPLTHENEAHVHDVMERVKHTALERAIATRGAEHKHTKKFIARPFGSYAGTQGVTRFK